MKPFDIVTDISTSKKCLINRDNEKEYNPFIVNRAFSYFPDTIFYAQEMNFNHHADNLLQHDYLFYSLRKAKRFSKWTKKQQDDPNYNYILAIQEYYKYSYRRAEEVLKILSQEQLDTIKLKLEKGGV